MTILPRKCPKRKNMRCDVRWTSIQFVSMLLTVVQGEFECVATCHDMHTARLKAGTHLTVCMIHDASRSNARREVKVERQAQFTVDTCGGKMLWSQFRLSS